MTNQLTTTTKNTFLEEMAANVSMDPQKFKDTVIATAFSLSKDKAGNPVQPSDEVFATFMLVAKRYNLDPLTKQIYGFPGQGGKVQTVVSIDGWLNMINSHPQFDGMEFEDIVDTNPNGGVSLRGIKCTIYRKDRSRPTSVTEYFKECKRDTDPWNKSPHRMLQHKAAIQCARYAFSFSDIVDPDEAERMNMKDITPEKPKAASILNAAPEPVLENPVTEEGEFYETYDDETGEIIEPEILEPETAVEEPVKQRPGLGW